MHAVFAVRDRLAPWFPWNLYWQAFTFHLPQVSISSLYSHVVIKCGSINYGIHTFAVVISRVCLIHINDVHCVSSTCMTTRPVWNTCGKSSIPACITPDQFFFLDISSRTNMTCDKSSKIKVWQIVQVLKNLWQIVHIILVHIAHFCDISSRTNVICDKSSNNPVKHSILSIVLHTGLFLELFFSKSGGVHDKLTHFQCRLVQDILLPLA